LGRIPAILSGAPHARPHRRIGPGPQRRLAAGPSRPP
jgi:hypothetical protein